MTRVLNLDGKLVGSLNESRTTYTVKKSNCITIVYIGSDNTLKITNKKLNKTA